MASTKGRIFRLTNGKPFLPSLEYFTNGDIQAYYTPTQVLPVPADDVTKAGIYTPSPLGPTSGSLLRCPQVIYFWADGLIGPEGDRLIAIATSVQSQLTIIRPNATWLTICSEFGWENFRTPAVLCPFAAPASIDSPCFTTNFLNIYCGTMSFDVIDSDGVSEAIVVAPQDPVNPGGSGSLLPCSVTYDFSADPWPLVDGTSVPASLNTSPDDAYNIWLAGGDSSPFSVNPPPSPAVVAAHLAAVLPMFTNGYAAMMFDALSDDFASYVGMSSWTATQSGTVTQAVDDPTGAFVGVANQGVAAGTYMRSLVTACASLSTTANPINVTYNGHCSAITDADYLLKLIATHFDFDPATGADL